jgi:hypothetical protein
MKPAQITSGNASVDGLPFQSWFVGNLEKWAANRNTPLPGRPFDLNQSSAVEIKWAEHRAGEMRPDWAECSDKRSISILVRGKFLLRFRSPENPGETVERRLEHEGDYAIWGTNAEHTWVVEEDSVVVTVRWREREA